MLSLAIARRLVGRIGFGVAALPVLVSVAFAFGSNVFLDEQTLTGRQEADRLPGRFSASISRLDLSVPMGSDYAKAVQDRLGTDAGSTVVSLQALDVPMYQLADDGLYFREMPWQPAPFPDVFALSAGRYPVMPGEVAVVGDELARRVALGDRLDLLTQTDALTVVGVVDDRFTDNEQLLAAPGTWASLEPPADGADAPLASPTLFIPGKASDAVLRDLAAALVVETPALADSTRQVVARDLERAVRTRADAMDQTERKWTSRSPLSFWIPVLTVVPTAIAMTFWALMRRLGPAARAMKRQGVRRHGAVLGAWLAVMVGVGAVAVLGAVAGAAVGHLAAQLGAGTWSEPGATWRSPTAGALAVFVAVALGGFAGWALLWSATTEPRTTNTRRIHWSEAASRNVRHGAATLVGCTTIFTLNSVERPADAMRLAGLTAVLAALVAPDLLSLLVHRLRTDRLRARLTGRILRAYHPRNALLTAALAMTIALTTGFLVSAASAMDAERAARETTALPGQVALDNDDAASLPVQAEVVQAAESVRALADQHPVQLYEVVSTPMGRLPRDDQRVHVGLMNQLGLTFATDSAQDVSRSFGRDLTAEEETTLHEGGVLVLYPPGSTLDESVELVESESHIAVGSFPAIYSEITMVPWYEAIAAVMLTSTAKEHGLGIGDGALIYTGVTAGDAQDVLAALSARGINPENAEIHRQLSPIVPAGAVIGSAALLFLLLLFLAIFATRAQILAMRPWASRLTQLGIKLDWARSVVIRQYQVILAVAVPLGVLAGVVPLVLADRFAPRISFVVPWLTIATMLIALVAAVAAACWLSTRAIGSQHAIGWQDHGE